MTIELQPCPRTPNCVSTEATDQVHAIAPLRYTGSAATVMQRLRDVLSRIPRTTIVVADATMIRAEFRTLIFRFVDDAIFIVDDATKSIRFRSASRIGQSDLGVNRRRMERIRRMVAEP